MSYNPPLISGPIAPENNPPINPQYYQPSVFTISGLSYGPTTLVTTSVNHNYVIGQNIRLLIPKPYGAYQLNEQQGLVISIPAANQVVVTINSMNTDAFVSSLSYSFTLPQIIAIGDINSGNISSTGRRVPTTAIPGSFINISPV